MTPEQVAVLWLASLTICGLAYFVWSYRRSDYSTWESCLYLPTYLLGRLLWRVHFTNAAPAEIKSGAIMAANHRSSVDPFFVQLAARRRVHWMVAQEYCRHRVFGPLLRALEVIPTNRSGMDTASTKAALRITQAGRLVGMFPEGRINQTAQPLLPLRAGAALVAMRSKVPLIPLWIEGSPLGKTVWSPLFMPAHVRITFGAPIYPDHVSVASGLADSSSTQFASEKNEAQPAPELMRCDELIVQWGRQILTLAGQCDKPVRLASQRKHRNRAYE